MQTDYQTLQKCITKLSYARSNVDMIYSQLEQSITSASRSNISPKFKRCLAKMEEVKNQLRKAANELTEVGKTVSRVQSIVSRLD